MSARARSGNCSAVWEVQLWFNSCFSPGAGAAPGGNTALLWWRKSTLWGKLMSGRWCIVEKQNYNRIISSSSLHNMKWTLMLQRSGFVSHAHFDHPGFILLFFLFFQSLYFPILKLAVKTIVMAPWSYAQKREGVCLGFFVYSFQELLHDGLAVIAASNSSVKT